MDKKGFSLAEVLVASVLLVLTVGSILFMFSTQRGVVTHTGRGIMAMAAAQQLADDLRNKVRADTWDTGDLSNGKTLGETGLEGDFGAKFDAHKNYQVVDDSSLDAAYRKVTVTINWDEPTQE